MLFKAHILDQIASGQVTLAFRYWQRPSVRVGGQLRTGAGVLQIDRVAGVSPDSITDKIALSAGYADRHALMKTLVTGAGRSLYRIDFHRLGNDPRVALRHDGDVSDTALAEITGQLAAMDLRCKDGPWTATALRMIAGTDPCTAGDIALALSMDKPALKRRIRKLKELGLTESLARGYRLSPRGARLWAMLRVSPETAPESGP